MPSDLRLVTANLLAGRDPVTGAADPPLLSRAAQLLDGDVVALQEVDRGQPRSGGVDQASLVAGELGAREWRYVATLAGTPGLRPEWSRVDGDGALPPPGPSYGVALLSRLPVLRWETLRFPPAPVRAPLLVPDERGRTRLALVPDEPRVVVAAVVDAPGGPVTVLATHLSFVPGTNARQLRALARWARELPAPRVLLGDLNLPASVPAWLTGWHRLAREATYPSYAPRVQLDHVLTDDAATTVVAAATRRLPVSDHLALTVTLRR